MNALKEGESYRISAQVYGGIGQMTVYFYDKDGDVQKDLTINLATEKAAKEWQELSADFKAEANMASIAVKVSTTDAGKEAVYFDAVTLATKADDSFVLKLENGSFDADWEGASIAPGWINVGNAKTKFERVPNGDGYALQITKASGAGYKLYTEKFAVAGSKAYTFTIDFKGKLQSSCQLYMYFYGADGTQLGNCKTIVVGDYSDEWVTIAVNGIAPADAARNTTRYSLNTLRSN